MHVTLIDLIFAYVSFSGKGKIIIPALTKRFISGIIDTVLSLISTINFRLFDYFWPVSTAPGKNVITGVVDTGDKLL